MEYYTLETGLLLFVLLLVVAWVFRCLSEDSEEELEIDYIDLKRALTKVPLCVHPKEMYELRKLDPSEPPMADYLGWLKAEVLSMRTALRTQYEERYNEYR